MPRKTGNSTDNRMTCPKCAGYLSGDEDPCVCRSELEVERLLGNLRRIKTSWNSLGLTCDCGPVGSGEACDICEIDFMLQDVEDEYA